MRVLWRPRGRAQWIEGQSVNASRSGVLFRTDLGIDVGTTVEVLLSGRREPASTVAIADVLCEGRIVRKDDSGGTALAATIESYTFLPRPERRDD
jgi:hypothetical protein